MASVELHFDRLDRSDAALGPLYACLAEHERLRSSQFRFTVHRRRFIVRRARLRQVLGQRLGVPPAELVLAEGPFGKPFVPGWDRHFSASHSGDTMLLALSDKAVGCDIEAEQSELEWLPLADRLFAAGEIAALARIEDANAGRAAFFRCWSRKEAFVKAIGQGLSYPLESFEVSVGFEAQLLAGGDGWTLASLPFPGIACAIATADDGTLPSLVVAAD